MYKKIIILFVILFAVSLIVNIYFIFNTPFTITHKHTYNNQQYQFQGQLMMNMYMAEGTKIEWVDHYIERTNDIQKDEELISKFLMSLHPTSSFFRDIYRYDKFIVIKYPNFLKEK